MTATQTLEAATEETADLVLRVDGLAKRFGATRAVRDVGFDVRRGEVHAIVGENGSGKSTLVKMLSGVHAPDAGVITVEGVGHASLDSPRAAQELGIVTVFQEVLSVENRTVLDNLWLGAEGLFRRRLGRSERESRARAVLSELMADPPPLTRPLEDLTLSERQLCSIARALLREPRVLILDESTSALDYESCDRLFSMVRRLRESGTGVILITHRMDEIDALADRVTVLRSGVSVETIDSGWTPQQLIELMTGGAHLTGEIDDEEPRGPDPDAPVVLEVEDLRLSSEAEPISLTVRAGELIGLAGLEGNGQDAFIKALAGLRPSSGEITRVEGESRRVVSRARGAARAGIAYVARERRAEALFEWMSILDNFAIPTIRRDARAGLVSRSRTMKRFESYVSPLRIKFGKATDPITTLSGGNQQKVVIARWLAASPQVLLLNDPTRGIDINAKRDLYRLLRSLSRDGVAVVMLSTEVDEHVELMDRVLVFRDQTCSAEFSRGGITREIMVASFFGKESEWSAR